MFGLFEISQWVKRSHAFRRISQIGFVTGHDLLKDCSPLLSKNGPLLLNCELQVDLSLAKGRWKEGTCSIRGSEPQGRKYPWNALLLTPPWPWVRHIKKTKFIKKISIMIWNSTSLLFVNKNHQTPFFLSELSTLRKHFVPHSQSIKTTDIRVFIYHYTKK